MSAWHVRAARPADLPRIVRALPSVARHPSQSMLLVLEKDYEFAGGCALRFTSPEQCLVLWHLLPDARPGEALPLLLEVAKRKAIEQGSHSLFTERPFAADAEEARVLPALGFRPEGEFVWLETDLARGAELFDRGQARLDQRKKIPPSARVCRLAEAPGIPIHHLVSHHIGRLPDAPIDPGFYELHSAAAMDGSKVAGIVLIDRLGAFPLVLRMAVDLRYRNQWPYVVLMRAAHRSLLAAGFTKVRFKTDPSRHPALRNFARRIEGRELRREHHYALAF